jgi:protein ImuB
MRRVVCVWFPTFASDLVRRRLEQRSRSPDEARKASSGAVLLTRRVASREIVARRCAVAARAGVTEEVDLTHARSLLPARMSVHVEPHRPDREAAALHALACRALKFTPLSAPDPPDGLVLDITGTERLHRGEDRVLAMISRDFRWLGLSCRVCAAPTIGSAWAVSRFGTRAETSVPAGGEREALASLPVSALRVSPAIVAGLDEVGVHRVADLMALPRGAVASRFDGELVRRWRQVLGELVEMVDPVRPRPPIRSEVLFDGPTDQWESIESATHHVVSLLAAELTRQDRGVRVFDVAWLRPRAEPTRVSIALSRPSAVHRHLWSLVRSRLERLDLGEGVEGVVATASRTARLRLVAGASLIAGHDLAAASEAAWGELIDTLVGRFGADGVLAVDPIESHLPERACAWRSVMERGPGRVTAMARSDRPTVLLSRPEPIEVVSQTPDGPVVRVRWRGVWHEVAACRGPEWIGQEWWRWRPGDSGAPGDREYFVAQLSSGRRLWLFRYAGTSRWLLHGEWS